MTFTVQKPGGSPFDFETITLTNATILSYEEKAGFATRVALGYDKVEVEQVEQNANGSPGTPHTFTFDLRTNGGTLASPPTDALVPTVPTGGTFNYFLNVAGVTGGSQDAHHVGAFDALGYEFDLASTIAASTGGGGGAGKTTPSPLIVDLATDITNGAAAPSFSGELLPAVTVPIPGMNAGLERGHAPAIALVGADALIGFHQNAIARFIAAPDRADSRRNSPLALRRPPVYGCAARSGILLFARDALRSRQEFGGDAHQQCGLRECARISFRDSNRFRRPSECAACAPTRRPLAHLRRRPQSSAPPRSSACKLEPHSRLIVRAPGMHRQPSHHRHSSRHIQPLRLLLAADPHFPESRVSPSLSGRVPLRFTTASTTATAKSSERTSRYTPFSLLERPIGVRTAATITGRFIVS